MSEWIKVDDRLPEKWDYVYIYCLEKNSSDVWSVHEAQYGENIYKDVQFIIEDCGGGCCDKEARGVTHWMPILGWPEPPKDVNGV